MAQKRKVANLAETAAALLENPLQQIEEAGGLRFRTVSQEFASNTGKIFLVEKKNRDVLGTAFQQRFENVGLTQFYKPKTAPEDHVPHRGIGYVVFDGKDGEVTLPKMKLTFSPEQRKQFADMVETTLKQFLSTRAFDPMYSKCYEEWFGLADGTKVMEATKSMRDGLQSFAGIAFEDCFDQPNGLAGFLEESTDTHYQDVTLGPQCKIICLDERSRSIGEVDENDECVYTKKGITVSNTEDYRRLCDSEFMRTGSWKADVILRLTSIRLEMRSDTNGKDVIFPVFRFKNCSTTILHKFKFASASLKEDAKLLTAALDTVMMTASKKKKARKTLITGPPKTPKKSAVRKKINLDSDDEGEEEDEPETEILDDTDDEDEEDTYAPHLARVVEGYQNLDATSRYIQKEFNEESVLYHMETYKQLQWLHQCSTEIQTKLPRFVLQGAKRHCEECFGVMKYIPPAGANVCVSCGVSVQVHDNENYDFIRSTTHNCKPIHRYSPEEHFAQYVHDFSGLSNKTIPKEVMDFCEHKAGNRRNDKVTHRDVFKWLCSRKYREYYSLKYIIANRLRVTPEFKITIRQVELLKQQFKVYIKAIYPFMVAANIGYISSRGRYRNYWPTAFILQRLLERIGRPELAKYVIVENTKERYLLYLEYWNKLEDWMQLETWVGPNYSYDTQYIEGIKKTKRVSI